MKRGTIAGPYVFRSVSFGIALTLPSGDIVAETQQKVLLQRKALMVVKPSVTSVNPQKAVLTQGGDPVVVQATGEQKYFRFQTLSEAL
jgi:hypothetical protein